MHRRLLSKMNLVTCKYAIWKQCFYYFVKSEETLKKVKEILVIILWAPEVFSRMRRGIWSAAGRWHERRSREKKFARITFFRLNQNRKPRMKSLWQPGYCHQCFFLKSWVKTDTQWHSNREFDWSKERGFDCTQLQLSKPSLLRGKRLMKLSPWIQKSRNFEINWT